jgi:predicted DNA-binding ribbon-helix-helix protein
MAKADEFREYAEETLGWPYKAKNDEYKQVIRGVRGALLPSLIVKRSVAIHGHNTSISLEPEFWAELKKEAVARRLSLADLVDKIDEARTHGNLSSACRCHILARALNVET